MKNKSINALKAAVSETNKDAGAIIDNLRSQLDKAQKPIQVIEVCERLCDRVHGVNGQPDQPKYHAQIQIPDGTNGSPWDCGTSIDAAIGSLIRSHPEKFGIKIKFLGRLPR